MNKKKIIDNPIFMNTKHLITSALISSLLVSCVDQRTPEEEEERVDEIRKEGAQLQETVQDMQPEIDEEAQETIDKVEKRVERQSK